MPWNKATVDSARVRPRNKRPFEALSTLNINGWMILNFGSKKRCPRQLLRETYWKYVRRLLASCLHDGSVLEIGTTPITASVNHELIA